MEQQKPIKRWVRAIQSPRVKKNCPAYKVVITRFGGLTLFSEMTGFHRVTVHNWMRAGLIPAKWLEPGLSYQRHIIECGKRYGIEVLAEDFIEETGGDHR